jgi:hypothetical protein
MPSSQPCGVTRTRRSWRAKRANCHTWLVGLSLNFSTPISSFEEATDVLNADGLMVGI